MKTKTLMIRTMTRMSIKIRKMIRIKLKKMKMIKVRMTKTKGIWDMIIQAKTRAWMKTKTITRKRTKAMRAGEIPIRIKKSDKYKCLYDQIKLR